MDSNHIASHTFQIPHSPLETIHFTVFRNDLEINITSSIIEPLRVLQGPISRISFTSLHTEPEAPYLHIEMSQHGGTVADKRRDIYALLDHYSNHFGGNERLACSVRYTLEQGGYNLRYGILHDPSEAIERGMPAILNRLCVNLFDPTRAPQGTRARNRLPESHEPSNRRVLTIIDRILLMQALILLSPAIQIFLLLQSIYAEVDEARHSAAAAQPVESVNAQALEHLDVEIPAKYCCPITLSIMTNPVYIEGDMARTRFEHDAIMAWWRLDRSHPLTRVQYGMNQIVVIQPDTALKAEIDEFVARATSSSQPRP